MFLLVKFAKKNLNCRELGIFLGVNFGLKILLRVKELTFRNSVCKTKFPLRGLVRKKFDIFWEFFPIWGGVTRIPKLL